MLFDTEFVIALGRGGQSVGRQRCDRFLVQHRPPQLYTSRVSWAEVAEGFESPLDHAQVVGRFTLLEVDAEIAWIASRLARQLKSKGQHIGDNDVWIAATAVAFGLPLVSNNKTHFGRVPGLKLLAY